MPKEPDSWTRSPVSSALSRHLFPGSSSSSTRCTASSSARTRGWAWGLSIVSLVVLIRICLIPLFVKQIKATRNMQALQPKMKAIQERYKNDKQRQSEEMMKLYKETGTNPLSSCLPILAQSPFFFALYHVLNTSPTTRPSASSTRACWTAPEGAHLRCSAGREVHGQRREGRGPRRVADRRPHRHGDHDRPDVGVAVLHAAPADDEERRPHGEDAVHAAAEDADVRLPGHVRRLRHQLPRRCPRLLADHQRVDHGPADVRHPPQPDPGPRRRPLPGALPSSVSRHGKVQGRREEPSSRPSSPRAGPQRARAQVHRQQPKAAVYAAQADGTVVKSDTGHGRGRRRRRPQRQQPKRQSKSSASPECSRRRAEQRRWSKTDEPQDGKPKPAAGLRRARSTKSGQRKGQQRPKTPSKK